MGMAWAAYELNGVIDEDFGYGPAALLLTSDNLKICLNGVPTNQSWPPQLIMVMIEAAN